MKVYSRRITLLYSVNNITAQPTADGSVTVHFGGCEEGRVNSLPIMEGWNYAAGLNNLRKGVLEDKYQFPRPKPSRGFLFSHIPLYLQRKSINPIYQAFLRLFFFLLRFAAIFPADLQAQLWFREDTFLFLPPRMDIANKSMADR